MLDFYTNVQVYGSKILFRGIEAGQPIQMKLDYEPTLFTLSESGDSKYSTIHEEALSPLKTKGIREAREMVKKYKDVENFPIYGNQRYEYSFISDNYKGQIEWDISKINVANIDIEVGSENGFPEPEDALEPITSITFKQGKTFVVLGCGDFDNIREDVRYIKCHNEVDLIEKFLDQWSSNYPDVVTGWNIKFFDIPYLVNRITRVLGEAQAKRLSPWNTIYAREVNLGYNRKSTAFTLLGIANLDYIDMYQRYAPAGKSQESYKLDAIAHVELGENKLSYSEYEGLHGLYRDNYQLFIEYNIKDVELIDKLDDKLKLIELVLTLAYDSKTNYEDAFTQVRMWDILIYNHLRERNMVIPPNTHHTKSGMYIGGYVKEPQVGLHEYVASFDLNSLYPHLIMQYNISPEMLIEPSNQTYEMKELAGKTSIDGFLERKVDTSILKEQECTVTPNGQFFYTHKQGFLAEMMETMYNDRSEYKRKMITAKKEYEREKGEAARLEISKRIARYNNLQLAKKVCLNSAYGALGNEFFRFFDIRQAAAVTTAGQLSIRWVANDLNAYMNKLLGTKDEDFIIASDTDSVYMVIAKLVHQVFGDTGESPDVERIITFMDKVCEDKIQPFIDNSYNSLAEYTNAFSQKMEMKREVLCDKAIWTAKKRYILNVWDSEGVRYEKPKLKVSGLEMVKSSTPSSCRTKLWECLDLIVNSDEASVIKFITDFRDKFKSMEPGDIAFPRGVNGLEKYSDKDTIFGKKCPIHVRGSLVYNHSLKEHDLTKKYPFIKGGEKIKYLYLKEPNSLKSNIIAFHNSIPAELDIMGDIDYNIQYDKSFVEPLKIILDSIGWKTEHRNSLEDHFG